MLRRLCSMGCAIGERQLARVYSGQFVRVQEWLKCAPGVHVLPVSYAQVLEDPARTEGRPAALLGGPFDQQSAAACVDPAPRRQMAAEGRRLTFKGDKRYFAEVPSTSAR
jgi:hypothetical protein